MSFDVLTKEMDTEKRKWAFCTKAYGTINASFRVFLIITSAIVAAQNNLQGSPAKFIVPWIPLLALTVTIVTALDTWLKPRDKWRGFMGSRDALTDLVVRAKSAESTDAAKFDQLREEFFKLREMHRKENVF